MNLASRTVHSALSNIAGWIVPILLGLIFTPYIVGTLGAEAYGLLALVWALVGYFALLDLGLGNAVIKYVAESAGRRDDRGVEEIVGSATLVFLAAGIGGALLVMASADILTHQLIKIPVDLLAEASQAVRIAALGFLATVLLTLFTAVCNGLNRYDITNLVNVSLGVVTTVGTAALLFLGFGLIAIVVLSVVVSFGGVLGYLLIVSRLLNGLEFLGKARITTIVTLLRFGVFTLLARICDLVNRQADKLLIGGLLGVQWITYFAVPLMLVSRLTGVAHRVGSVAFPAISELQGRGEEEKISEIYLTASRLVFTMTIGLCVPLLILGKQFLSVWMGPDFAAQSGSVLLLITVGVSADMCTVVPTGAAMGLGKPRVAGLAAVVHSVIYVGCGVALASRSGIDGVALAYLLSNVVVAVVFVWYVNSRVMAVPLKRLVSESFLRPIAAAGLVVPVMAWVAAQHIEKMVWMMAAIAGSMVIYFGASLLVGVLGVREREVLATYFRERRAGFERRVIGR